MKSSEATATAEEKMNIERNGRHAEKIYQKKCVAMP